MISEPSTGLLRHGTIHVRRARVDGTDRAYRCCARTSPRSATVLHLDSTRTDLSVGSQLASLAHGLRDSTIRFATFAPSTNIRVPAYPFLGCQTIRVSTTQKQFGHGRSSWFYARAPSSCGRLCTERFDSWNCCQPGSARCSSDGLRSDELADAELWQYAAGKARRYAG